MNLNYDNSPESLFHLIAQADPSIESHNIAIDYDGEVIIDPELHYPHVDTARYKFCTHVKDISLHHDYMIKALYKALLSIYEKDIYYTNNYMGYEEGRMNIAA